MAFHRCVIRLEDGSLIAEGIDVSLEETERGGQRQWYGTISGHSPNSVNALIAGQRYRLVLDDGRTGICVVRRNTSAGTVERAVSIQGAGPLTNP